MEIAAQTKGGIMELRLQGRMDTFGARQLQEALAAAPGDRITVMVWDMREVTYLSSAGLRVLLAAHKQLAPLGGGVLLAGLRPYCREVISTAGFEDLAPQFADLEEARRQARQMTGAVEARQHWDMLENALTNHGEYRIIPGNDDPGRVDILGNVRDVLYASATPERLASKHFFSTEYSLGLGGLGDEVKDYFDIMGEMMTVGGTMVWLPTDGHDTPDFMIPRRDSERIQIRTTFNVTLCGGFNELISFKSRDPDGIPISTLYRELFDLARSRRPDFKGILGLAARLQMAEVYGSGVKKSPVQPHAPADGKMITHPRHLSEWFDSDSTPRHRDVTGLLVGLGADLSADLSDYDDTLLNRVFYLHPANISAKTELLHNHMVIFRSQPMPADSADLEQDIQDVIRKGEFLDMRHLLDTSRATEGLLGLNYVQLLAQEAPPAALSPAAGQISPPPPEIQQKLDYYRRMTATAPDITRQ